MTQTKRWFNIKQREPIVNPASYIHIVGYRPSSTNLRTTRDEKTIGRYQQHAANHLREICPTHLVRMPIYIFVSCRAHWRLRCRKCRRRRTLWKGSPHDGPACRIPGMGSARSIAAKQQRNWSSSILTQRLSDRGPSCNAYRIGACHFDSCFPVAFRSIQCHVRSTHQIAQRIVRLALVDTRTEGAARPMFSS